ncbi:MAG: 4-hydroxy-tetrahydrodipicolinate reductase [Chitinophagaceae bacterium]|nr:4-hydroxy-tetrahydrodipicolinate reductase [Chitinophagaceae bacterium]
MRIALIGYGKMGKAIEEIALQKGHTISIRIDQPNLHEFTAEFLKDTDVAIEFTGPHSAFENISKCIELGIPVVSGSTGWTEKLDEIKQLNAAKNSGLIWSSNFSVGVNVFFEVNKKLAVLMAPHHEYEVIVEETHHTQKKDAPSGTAITLAEQVMESVKRKKQWVNEISDNPEDLEIISQRVDPAPGTHQIRYSSVIDTIEITHTAHNRKGFASGAVLAAEFLAGKKGFYTMKDVLHL